MINHLLQLIIESPKYQIFVGLATIFSLIAIFIQMHRNSAEEKATRTIDLMGRYYRDYHNLNISSKFESTPHSDELQEIQQVKEPRRNHEENYSKQLNFLYELAMYWKMGLIDKRIIRHELSSKIAFEAFVLQETYKGQEHYLDRLRTLLEMRDEVVMKDPMNYKLVKFWKSLGIRKYYYP